MDSKQLTRISLDTEELLEEADKILFKRQGDREPHEVVALAQVMATLYMALMLDSIDTAINNMG